jgi:hypothetical protein
MSVKTFFKYHLALSLCLVKIVKPELKTMNTYLVSGIFKQLSDITPNTLIQAKITQKEVNPLI